MEQNYRHDGWIKKLFLPLNTFDFTAPPYETALEGLHQTLKPFFNGTYAQKQAALHTLPSVSLNRNMSIQTSDRHSFSNSIPYIDADTISNKSHEPIQIKRANSLNNSTNKTMEEEQVKVKDDNHVSMLTHDRHNKTMEEEPVKVKDDPLKWQSSEITKWAERCDLKNDYGEFLNRFNGKTLKLLYAVKKDAPEYFYKTISQNDRITFDAVAKFVYALDDLFDEEKNGVKK